MNDLVEVLALVTFAQDGIRPRIHTIQGMQVVLDAIDQQRKMEVCDGGPRNILLG